MARRNPPKIDLSTPIGPDVDIETSVVRDRRGRRITQEYVDELIEAARKPGRPSLGKGRSPAIAFRLPEDLRSQADALAAQEGKTVSQLAREALEDLVRRSS